MKRESVNTSLKRSINKGSEYEAYFKNASCTPTFLGESDTDFTLKMMKKLATQYKGQTKAISKLFENRRLDETITDLHSFLYNHFQYEIDGLSQNLKSPNCAWSTRFEGMDCKSYSLFASTVLLNLGIKHYFRKIKQPNLSPENWTHVYVVIPVDQKNAFNNSNYYVIDGTINPNKEVPFTQKKDLLMKVKLPHYGLNSAGLSCACESEPHSNHGLAAPAETKVIESAVAKFHAFLDQLEAKGVSPDVTQSALKKLEQFLNQGIDPKISDLLPAQVAGLGFYEPTNSYVPNEESNEEDGSAFMDSILSLLDGDFFGNTFGAVFANGFNLSCWNSSSSPAEASRWFEESLYPFFTQALNAAQNLTDLNLLGAAFTKLDSELRAIEAHQLFHKAESRAECSKEGNQLKADAARTLYMSLESEVNKLQGYTVTKTKQNVEASIIKPNGILIKWKGTTKTVQHTVYSIQPATSNPNTDSNNGSSTNNGGYNSTTIPNFGGYNNGTVSDTENESNSTSIAGGSLIAIAAISLASWYMKNNKNKSNG